MKLPNWLLSSTGEGLSKRVISFLTFGVSIAGFFGIQVIGLDIEGAGRITAELFAAITAIISVIQHVRGWLRAIQFKREGLGKYSQPLD